MAVEDNTVGQQYYSIVLKIPGYKFNSEDILNMYFIRAPLQKISTLTYLTCPIPMDMFNILNKDLETNKFNRCVIEIWTVDIKKPIKGNSFKKTKLKMLVKKTYILNNLTALTEFSNSQFQNSAIPIAQFRLINEALFYLQKHSRYNTSNHNITAYKCLQNYNDQLKIELGDALEFIENIPKKHINNYQYETITAQGYNDIILPFYIIKNYKVLNTHSYYFFDDFYYDVDSKKDITVFFNSLTLDNQYKKINITDNKYNEFQGSLQILKREPIIDSLDFFDNPSKVYNLYIETFNGEIVFNRAKESQVPNLKVKDKNSKSKQDNARFNVSNTFDIRDKKQIGGNALVRLYTPDNIENAKLRFANYSDLIRNQMNSIWSCSSNNCFIDVIQFNKVYNLDANDIGNYNFLPIMIINKFSREENDEQYMRHSVKFQAIKFNK